MSASDEGASSKRHFRGRMSEINLLRRRVRVVLAPQVRRLEIDCNTDVSTESASASATRKGLGLTSNYAAAPSNAALRMQQARIPRPHRDRLTMALRSWPSERRGLFHSPASRTMSRKDGWRDLSGLFLDAIAEEPLGIDGVKTQPMLEFLAQFTDVALDDILVDILVEKAVDGVKDLRFADPPTATA